MLTAESTSVINFFSNYVIKEWGNESKVIRIEKIVSKMVFISVKNFSTTSMTDYLCLQPNSFEVR